MQKMTRKRRSKLNKNTMVSIDLEEHKRSWRYNPNCKYKEIVKKIEQEKRLSGEDD